MKIKNINENFGEPVEFETVEEMAAAIQASGYELPADGLLDGRDYCETVSKKLIDYLLDRYDLDGEDDIRIQDGSIQCNGRMPNSIEHGWFFAGYESEIAEEMQRNKEQG